MCWQPGGSHGAGCVLEAAPLLAAAMLIMLCMASGDMLDIMLVAIWIISGDICMPAAASSTLSQRLVSVR